MKNLTEKQQILAQEILAELKNNNGSGTVTTETGNVRKFRVAQKLIEAGVLNLKSKSFDSCQYGGHFSKKHYYWVYRIELNK